MGIMDKIKKVTGTNDGYDNGGYNSEDDGYYDGFDAVNGDFNDVPMGDEDVQVANGGMNMGATQQVAPQSNAAPANSGNGSIGFSGTNVNMKVVRPKNYDGDSASQIANHLLNRSTVILNLEQTNKESSRRLIDFLTGVAYSIGGTIKKITDKTYVVTPANVDVDDAKIKPTPRRGEAQQETREEAASEDFSDFN